MDTAMNLKNAIKNLPGSVYCSECGNEFEPHILNNDHFSLAGSVSEKGSVLVAIVCPHCGQTTYRPSNAEKKNTYRVKVSFSLSNIFEIEAASEKEALAKIKKVADADCGAYGLLIESDTNSPDCKKKEDFKVVGVA